MVEDIEKEKEVKATGWTLASVWPDAGPCVRSFINHAAQLVEGKVEGPDAGSGSTGASGHKLLGGEITRSDAQEERQVRCDVQWR
jgi:hypothetical protein